MMDLTAASYERRGRRWRGVGRGAAWGGMGYRVSVGDIRGQREELGQLDLDLVVRKFLTEIS